MYDRTCCALTPEQIATLEASGALRAIRFKVPQGLTAFTDLVHGPITFDNANIEDFVVLRSDRQPTYHLSVVVDDIDMEITHVVRGDDHISNTPKQVLLYGAFGRKPPQFAHVPLIMGPDKKRLSKRHGATSVMEYQRLGYAPEAMVNFLALLGWSPGTDQEVFTREELIAAFTLEGISGGNAVFNPDKLDWFNQQHLSRLPSEELAVRLEPLLRDSGLWRDEFARDERGWLLRLIDLLKPRAKRLGQIMDDGLFFLSDAIEYDESAVAKHLRVAGAREHLVALRSAFASVDPFEQSALETTLRSTAEARGVTPAALIHATRVAVTGRSVSPGLFEVLELLGRERTMARLDRAAGVASP
jgi:glutamyl-tRNA synthetase